MHLLSLLTLPYRWFDNIVALQEKRAFDISTVFLFTVFVSIARMLGQWTLAGNDSQLYVTDFLISFGFYWFCFFMYTAVLWLLVPQSWKRSINVILIGIFLGIFPPFIDALATGVGSFRYGYLWNFPAGFSPLLYNPAQRLPLGESLTLWATVFFAGLYVWYRARSLVHGIVAALLAWGVAVFNAGVLPTAIAAAQQAVGLPVEHRSVMITCAYLVLALVIYFFFQPKFSLGLLRRSIHALPFVLIMAAGAAFSGPLRFDSFVYAGVVLITFMVALAQNDWHDRFDDDRQGRELYVDAQDVNFMNVIGFALALTLLGSGSLTGLLLLLILAVSMLYSYPMYRAKRFFPSNLKIEGVWGASAFLIGIVAQAEHSAFGVPAWWIAGGPRGHTLGALAPQTLGAIALVFGGYSLIASLKDYKDRDADLAAGVQTWYTLAARRSWNETALHNGLVAASCLALFAPFPLLVWAGRFPMVAIAGAVPAVAAVWWLMHRQPSRRRFAFVLGLISAHLGYLVWRLALTAA